ncbi:DNA polymerase IV [Chitinophaga sedimenti]|uniref:DNA polymerase Y family protein n=1 Tax=Chitinophaga sedimenti TaxID=2033606 RepID=UPI002005BB55|nr:DNA polymerase IV [Chitinophaga sedimenti]MCK7559375.1 DNA polymerase IV [Chitinophaga sedimenti]
MTSETQRTIVNIDVDRYTIACERLRDRRLQHKPLLLVGASGRMTVQSCSREASRFGVVKDMSLREALRHCPQATVRKGDNDYYNNISDVLTDIIAESAPVFEKASNSEFYLDVTGMDRYIGIQQWVTELQLKMQQHSGLPPSYGLSINKTISKVATHEAFSGGGRFVVEKGLEKAFLAPMPVIRIPGTEWELYRQLCFKGVRKIDTLQHLPHQLLLYAHGQEGLAIWKKARAIDPAPVVPYRRTRELVRSQQFSLDTTDMNILHTTIRRLVAALGYELRHGRWVTAAITVKIRYGNEDTYTKGTRLHPQNQDSILTATALRLFDALYNRRLLIRMVEVRLSRLSPGAVQTSLFEEDISPFSLYRSLDKVRERFGFDALDTRL